MYCELQFFPKFLKIYKFLKKLEIFRFPHTLIGNPEPEVHWFKNGQPVNIDNVHIFAKKDSEGHHSLSIKDVRIADAGCYSCEAVNKVGRDETSAEVKFPTYGFERVKEEEVKPLFIEPLQQATVVEGQTVTLTCKVNEESKPEIQWYRDGVKVDITSKHITTVHESDGTIKLTIHEATSLDVGSYRCEASNRVGKADTSAKLSFKYAEQAQLESQQEESAFLGFSKPLTDQVVQPGQPAQFECKLETAVTDEVKIEWTKDAGKVPAEAKIEQRPDGTQRLVIEEVKMEHIGVYRCTATLATASAWTDARLMIKGSNESTFFPTFLLHADCF